MPAVFNVEIGELPQLADFAFHKTLRDVDFDRLPVTGLDADFYRRPVGDRLLSVGVYRLAGAETHRAWGWVGEAHCSWHAYWNPEAERFDGPFPGCPELRPLHADGTVYAFDLGPGRLCRRYLVGAGRQAGVGDRRDRDRQADGQPVALEGV